MTGLIDGEQFESLAHDLAAGGRWDLVLRLARGRLASMPDCPEAHRWAAWGELHAGHHDASLAHAEELRALEPDEPSTFRLWGEIHYRRSDWDQALGCLEEALARWPGNAHYHRMLICIYLKRNDGPAAIAAANETLRLDPGDLAARFALSLIKHQLSFRPDAVAQDLSEYVELLADDPHNPAILAQIGEVFLLRLNAPATALSYLEQALASDPSNSRIQRLYHMARCWSAEATEAAGCVVGCESPDAPSTSLDVTAPPQAEEWTVATMFSTSPPVVDTFAACIDGNSRIWTNEAVEHLLIS